VVGNSEEGEIVEPLPVTRSRPLGGRSKQTPDSVQSCVTRETLCKWSEIFSLPLDFHPRVPGSNERMHLPPEGEVAIYYDMLRICVRLPFNPFLNEFFKYYDLAPSQWSPKVYRYIAAFLLICGVQGVYPSMALWSCICYVTQNNNSIGWYSVSPTSRYSGLIEPGHTVRTGWKERFFFVKRDSTWALGHGWGVGNSSRFGVRKRSNISGSLLKDLRAWESYSGDPIAAADLSQARLELISCLFLGRVGTYLARDSLGLTNSKVVQC
jgi:hypothetical protein